MLGVLCGRSKPWILNSLATRFHGISQPHAGAVDNTPFHSSPNRRRHHSSACRLVASEGAAASIWHAIQPSACRKSGGGGGGGCCVPSRVGEPRGEGSWNVAWDSRPARWLHRSDSAWLLFGVCACLAPIDFWTEPGPTPTPTSDCGVPELVSENDAAGGDGENDSSADYKVTGVVADGRCLFRAIAHGACLRNGKDAPDENYQRELADELRAQVANELSKRRKEVEWFIEEDFETYVNRIQQPYVWGGEPELLMASHILKTMISVFMIDKTSKNLVSITSYGEEYGKNGENPINVLFHGYGHYDLLETLDKSCQKVTV